MQVDFVAVERYAKALFARAEKEGVLRQLAEEVRMMLTALGGVTGIQGFMISPNIPKSSKRALIEKTFASSEASQLDELALLLLDKGRVGHFTPIIERFLIMEEESRGVFPAEVRTALELDASQRDALQQALEAHTGHTLEIEFVSDPHVLGGIKFRHRDELLDSSLRSGLREIREAISDVRVH